MALCGHSNFPPTNVISNNALFPFSQFSIYQRSNFPISVWAWPLICSIFGLEMYQMCTITLASHAFCETCLPGQHVFNSSRNGHEEPIKLLEKPIHCWRAKFYARFLSNVGKLVRLGKNVKAIGSIKMRHPHLILYRVIYSAVNHTVPLCTSLAHVLVSSDVVSGTYRFG